MLGQLHDAGNTTTLAHYLELFAGAGLLTGLPKFSGNVIRRRASSPKLQVLNTALATAQSERSFADVRGDGEAWGRLVESAVGAHLANAAATGKLDLSWWREGIARSTSSWREPEDWRRSR
jgi:predicted AAA+ superfamily ATPase